MKKFDKYAIITEFFFVTSIGTTNCRAKSAVDNFLDIMKNEDKSQNSLKIS